MKAMILAAGKGERMRPLTLTTPKPLLQAGGKTLIDYHIDRLRNAGFNELVINRAWLGEKLKAYLGDGRSRGVSIDWSDEPQPLETAGGIRHALPKLSNKDGWFLVVNGDVWCDFPFAEVPRPQTGVAHLILTGNPDHNPNGDFHLEDSGKVASTGGNMLTFSGISLLHQDLFSGAFGDEAKLAPLLRRAADAGLVWGSRHTGEWFDIGTPQRLEQLDRWLNNERSP
ncbi:nucleotidyltransferase family protein [Hydrocarboniclastica marina]|uniref:Nucleotidyltransferase family protein n=2 Tax=Hydrocarboniclastica marina TaxID=2259620 RepID=A0A4P7XJG4_9ALTE|nr:nucleotidyltransferase family protein [Hydrocarboniclastica marina]